MFGLDSYEGSLVDMTYPASEVAQKLLFNTSKEELLAGVPASVMLCLSSREGSSGVD